MSDNLNFGSDQKFTIVKAVVDAGKETIEIGEKILEQVQGELGDLTNFQQEHDNCLSDLVKIAKTMEGEQQNLTSKGCVKGCHVLRNVELGLGLSFWVKS
ncbi:unnamed protein product [Meloidogyne enterolobii]|uniref:Uncharacterized protein n=1 Tax=Meloidogyne enterolobii TaxID=390850 RepID=A0ACB1AWZ1_MELEN